MEYELQNVYHQLQELAQTRAVNTDALERLRAAVLQHQRALDALATERQGLELRLERVKGELAQSYNTRVDQRTHAPSDQRGSREAAPLTRLPPPAVQHIPPPSSFEHSMPALEEVPVPLSNVAVTRSPQPPETAAQPAPPQRWAAVGVNDIPSVPDFESDEVIEVHRPSKRVASLDPRVGLQPAQPLRPPLADLTNVASPRLQHADYNGGALPTVPQDSRSPEQLSHDAVEFWRDDAPQGAWRSFRTLTDRYPELIETYEDQRSVFKLGYAKCFEHLANGRKCNPVHAMQFWERANWTHDAAIKLNDNFIVRRRQRKETAKAKRKQLRLSTPPEGLVTKATVVSEAAAASPTDDVDGSANVLPAVRSRNMNLHRS